VTRRSLGDSSQLVSGENDSSLRGKGRLSRISAPFVTIDSRAIDWSHHFEMPIYLPPPERGELRTLLDAAHYMLALPRHTFGKPAWQEAAKAVVRAARGKVSLEVAWFAICRALLLERLP
jgi:hypothetical protein